MFHFQGGFVHDEAAGNVADVFDGFEAVGFERAAGGHQIDNRVGEADQRGEFHRAVEFDDIYGDRF